jgi:hypothetical protein
MKPTFRIDTSGMKEAMNATSVIMRKEPREVLFQQGRLTVFDAAKFTPPMGGDGDGPVKESWSAQRKVGQTAVKRDIERVFKPISKVHAFEEIKNARSRATVKRYIQTGQTSKLLTVMQRLGIRASIVETATEATHKAQRDSRGRVRKNKTRFLVVQERTIAALVRKKQALVGTAKSGWNKAYAALGSTFPAWISGRSGQGIWDDKTNRGGDQMSIVVGNSVGFIQRTGAERNIMQRAISRRVESMRHQMEAALKKSFSGYKGGKYKGGGKFHG